ncbi:MAG: hypothetical protein U5K31_08035 [Balneolaceae bacterium]|nr:hypothetical protein [Balneolaceae bacterium]
MLIRRMALMIMSLLLMAACSQPQKQESASSADGGDPLSLGSIEFPNSATGEAEQELLTGVLALHSFWYPEARDHFRRARELNPRLAIAYWGEAMTHDHPLWQQHDQQAGMEVLNALDEQIGGEGVDWTDRERMYVEAARSLFDPESSREERMQAWAEQMGAIAEAYPEDDEALAFHALARMSLPGHDYDNPDPAKVTGIAADLENIYQRNPQHPGAMHYLIHVYDNDTFAPMGLRPAIDYADVAYSSSHAIHMPSHIYRQMEMWQEVIDANVAAWEASVAWQQETGRPLRDRDYHAYNWLLDTYLQVEAYGEACDVLSNVRSIRAEADSLGQDLGRIPSVIDHMSSQYAEETKEGALSCTE